LKNIRKRLLDHPFICFSANIQPVSRRVLKKREKLWVTNTD
jgi:hypothetical protein